MCVERIYLACFYFFWPGYPSVTVEFSLQVITAPMTSLNAIAIEAYKKYILVSLIQNGQVRLLLPLPSGY